MRAKAFDAAARSPGCQQLYLHLGHSIHPEAQGQSSGISWDSNPLSLKRGMWRCWQVYPRNSELLGLLAIMEVRAHTVSRLRRQLRSMLEATPSPQLWLLALRCEAALPGAAHRVQVFPPSRPHPHPHPLILSLRSTRTNPHVQHATSCAKAHAPVAAGACLEVCPDSWHIGDANDR